MKIDRNKLKKSTTEVPADCRALIEKLKTATEETLLEELRAVKAWSYGKCELYHWSDVLDKFDEVLEKACKKEGEKKWMLSCDRTGEIQLKDLLLVILHFTSLLIEHSFSRHLYNSMEHLTSLLSSSDMTVVLAVLNLLYVFSKRSNHITRLSSDKKQGLIVRLTHLAESWGGKDNGFGLSECCSNDTIYNFPTSATTLHFEFYVDNKEEKGRKGTANVITSIHMENLDKSIKMPSEIMEEILENFKVPEEKQMLLYTHIRLANLFSKYEARLQCVQARLQAMAILVYSNAIQDNMNALLYPGLIEELVDIIELKDENLVEIKAASLRTLTSIIHLERNPKLNNIIDATGASSYHGFLPVLVRSCIQHMTDTLLKPFPQPYATALFSFLYHLASYENGVEALVSCGMMECLLKVISWYGNGQDHITQFVTRAVRVVDLITNLDMAAFQTQGGLSTFLNRLEHEVEICRKENPFQIRIKRDSMSESQDSPLAMEMDLHGEEGREGTIDEESVVHDESRVNEGASTSTGMAYTVSSPPKNGVQCFPQRAALLKSMLNFLKKAIPDSSFSESIRHLMEGSLPKSLQHIISNAEYYGPSLFLLATDVVTVYVFQEPSLLSSLQDSGLTDVVLHALLIKDVPATREVLASLPNVFSALCLNTRGLEAFVNCKPFDRLFKVLLSPDYLPAMRRRRSSDPFGDTASNLGNAMDELMRHQPSLRTDATKAIIKLLEEICAMGMDPKCVCQKSQPKNEPNIVSIRSPQPPDNGSSDEEDEEEELANTQDSATTANKPPTPTETPADTSSQSMTPASQEKQAIPLMDYVLNVMKFVEAILSNNSTDDHCREFVTQKGLQPLMSILGLPNLPIDFPTSPACQAVSIVCKSILNLSREPQVLKQGLLKLDEVLQSLETLHQPLEAPGGSVLLRELANVAHIPDAAQLPQNTPLLHALSSCHAYILMFVHVCRMGQTDIRTISVNHWGSDLGLKVLEGLSKLYTSLVWESTVLLALCNDDVLPASCEFGKADMEKLLPKDFKAEKDIKEESANLTHSTGELGSNGVSAAMESLSTSESTETPMDVGDVQSLSTSSDKESKRPKMSPALQAQVKQLKPLLSVSSRLCRALAELFGLLVKLCVGSPVRQRRSHQIPPPPTTPSPAAQSVARALTRLLTNGLQWTPPEYSPVPKLRLTFLVCSVGFTSPMLFDEKKQPYHLMLQKFVSSGGQKALFEAFSWALSIDGKVQMSDGLEFPELPDGTGEFIDAWLMLVEKMVNPKTVLESTHTLPEKSSQAGFVPFSPVQYLISTQKAAFNAVMHLWNKKPLKLYGGRMSESILAILCHIIKGEAIIKEYLGKEKEETPSTSGNSISILAPSAASTAAAAAPTPASVPRPSIPEINPSHLQQLMDMGFSREHATQALNHTTSMEQATEYILTHPLVPAPRTPANPLGMVLEMSEEDQMMRAIAMSLGDNILMSTDESGPSSSSSKQEPPKPEETEIDEKQEKEEPLDRTTIDQFTDTVMPGCLTLLDTLPETVYRVCDLLIVVTQRNGLEWQKRVLSSLVQEVQSLGQKLLSVGHVCPSDEPQSGSNDKKAFHPDSCKFATRLHLFSLLFEEARMPCAETVEKVYLTDLLVQVLSSGQEFLTANRDYVSPKWLAPMLLLLDLYEKVSVISRRKVDAEKLLAASHTWKWFDDSTGRWCKYSLGNNKTIDDAYQSGESSIRFQAGRRRYTVHFNTMMQVNEETGNRRPIMLTLPTVEEKQQAEQGDKKVSNKEGEASQPSPVSESKMETEPVERKITRETKIVNGLNSDQITSVIRSVVALLNIPVEAESLHAALRLILRLTREHKFAVLFAELGGPKVLLNLTQASAFPGFVSLATLIFRHILEEPASLKYCMEKAIKKATSGSGSSLSGVQQGSMGSKELHYVLRVLGPAACRNPGMFTEVARNTLRIALPRPSKRDEDESRFYGPNAPQILKSISTKQVISHTVESPIKEVLYDLLNCLIVKCNYKEPVPTATSVGMEVKAAQPLSEAIAEMSRELQERQANMVRQNSSAELQQEEESTSQTDLTAEQGGNKDQTKEKDAKTAEDSRKQSLLMPKSLILRLLSEMVKSYGSCTQLITQHVYTGGQSELVPEECSVLAFVLDHLLPQCQVYGDRDCPALSRVFVASIASCNNRPDAQMALVAEIKNALQRSLCHPESSEKHVRIQSLTNLISIIIESCPSPGQVPNEVFKGQQTLMNNIVKSLLKKGVVTDLARIPHSLDLSSPYMANTINSALKPLETLSRSVNQPIQGVTTKGKGKLDLGEHAPGQESTTENTTTAAEGGTGNLGQERDVTIEDITDQADQHGDLEEAEPLEAEEPEHDLDNTDPGSQLQDVIDELLSRDSNLDTEREVLADIVMETEDISQASEQDDHGDDGDDELIDVEEMDHHDSHIVSQEISIEDEEGDDNTHVDVHDDDSAESGSDADEDDNDDGDNDDDQDDDDDDDEEDEEGSDMEAEDEDDYNDLEIDTPSGHQFHDENNVFNMEDMMFPLGNQHVIFNPLDNNHQLHSFNGLQCPISIHDNDNGNELAVPTVVPPAPSNVMATHPLLTRQPDTHGVVARIHRGGRQRGTCRYNPSTQTLHVNFPRPPNPPVILQRLLGPTTAADVLQLTSTLTSVAGPTPTRVMLPNEDLRIMSRPDEDLFEELFQEPYPDSSAAGTGVLTYIPSTLTRWTEEAKVLDGDSINDCMTVLKPEIMEVLEQHRDEELSERREKRKKAVEEEAAAKKEKEQNSKEASVDWVSPQQMEVSLDGMTPSSSSGGVSSSTTLTNTNQEANGRHISASEAAAAAELIATEMVEGILSTATPSESESGSRPPDGLLSTASPSVMSTFLTPANPLPLITPGAPLADRPRPRAPNDGRLNLASLLLSDQDPAPASQRTGVSTFGGLGEINAPLVGSQPVSVVPAAPTEGSITPEEVSGISSSGAVTVQSSASSEELAGSGLEILPTTSSPIISHETAQSIDSGLRSFLMGGASMSSVLESATGMSDVPTSTSGPLDPNTPLLPSSILSSLDPGSIPLPRLVTEGAIGGSDLRSVLPSTWTIPTTATTTMPTLGSTGSMEGPSSSRSASGTQNPSVPEGVDPSFLDALPDNIRQEVIAEQLRLQRIQQSAREQAQSAHSSGTMEVNAEFLAALPPNIQEEVLAQQRTEQARLQAQSTPAQPGTDTPVDPATFLATLPSSLRQQVLADMDDSMVAVLPPDLAAEAQSLRRELEDRHRRLMQDRLFAQAGAGSLSAILRHTGFAGRLGAGRYALRAVPRGSNQWAWGSNRMDNHSSSSGVNAIKFRGRHLLDHEALTCLIVLLFVDEPKINTSRLHRVLRNLCYHSPTRIWVIRALLSILQKTGDGIVEEGKCAAGDKGKKKATNSSPDVTWKYDTKSQGSWLSISLEAALGCRANVFQIQKVGKKHVPGGSCTGTVTVHPQAAPVVCRHVLDTLIALAKVFPSQFLPTCKAKEVGKCEEAEVEERQESVPEPAQSSPKQSTSGAESPKSETDFWDHLIKLDNVNMNRKGKGVQRTHNTSNTEGEANFYNFESSPLGQLMLMLSHPVVKRSQLLTDRLLRLLGLVSMSLPDATRGNRATSQAPTSTMPSLLSSMVTPSVVTPTTATSTSMSTATSALTTPAVTEVVTPSSTHSTTTPLEVKVSAKSEDTKKVEEEIEEAPVILEDQLKLAVKVLTSKSCSEEGLEDATNLLLRMSWANNATRNAVLRLLLEGTQELGQTVCSHIRNLLQELKKHSGRPKDEDEEMKDAEGTYAPTGKGILQDRFSQGTNIVVAAPKKVKGGRELQLPSMSLLTNKSSSQQFLLRILKVIIQLRDAARTMVKRGRRQTTSRDLGNIAEAMAALEAEAEAIIEMVGRRAQQNHQIRELQQRATPAAQVEPSEATPTSTATGEPGGANGGEVAPTGGSDQPTPTESARESGAETPMDIDQPGTSGDKKEKDETNALPRLSEQVLLDDLWTVLGDCLSELAKTPDHHAVLILQPAVEAFFIVHAGEKDAKSGDQPSQKREDQLAHLNLDVAPASPAAQSDPPLLNRENSVASMSSITNLPPDTQKFLKFAETHRTVLNQILRQSTTPLVDGPFSVLVDHTRILDFDVKRRYFRQELERLDEGLRREDLAVHVRREHVFEDSFRELFRRTVDEWKHRFYIVFEGEEGQDAGGLLREWYIIIAREIFNPMYALFSTSPGDRVTYTINPSSHCNSNHLSYYKFVGRIIAKAIYDNKLLECYFTRSFYKHIIGQTVKYTDMESEDYAFYQGLVFLLENDVKDIGYDLAFSTEIQEFGVTESRDLKLDGNKLIVTEGNKKEYVKLVCRMKMTGAIRKQLNAFMEGFYDIIPKRLISIFNEQELELLISGLPNIDIDDLKSNTENHKYQSTSLQVQWFWRALRSFEQSDRAQFLQFVTGTSKVPLQGFAFLEGMNGYQKFQIHRDDRSTERLPVAHTCFNQLDLPAYETYDKLRRMLLLAINECSEGFGLA
ncbi:E3 ubiquitin-protein ligase HUWE1-like isoform X3 [Mizuhopecten yessoensis]|uniref:E3 ubiquitin-protein ligase HUWE1-like isoform X3 n=1 Tax=Mizuhopecten yessoensis TaxID=6573 RepID=UPI000B45EAFC|nr:E3 ubiquitin-protein ligase HUWE1-like isoform X3 [Mizuhopecten yessoensis]